MQVRLSQISEIVSTHAPPSLDVLQCLSQNTTAIAFTSMELVKAMLPAISILRFQQICPARGQMEPSSSTPLAVFTRYNATPSFHQRTTLRVVRACRVWLTARCNVRIWMLAWVPPMKMEPAPFSAHLAPLECRILASTRSCFSGSERSRRTRCLPPPGQQVYQVTLCQGLFRSLQVDSRAMY